MTIVAAQDRATLRAVILTRAEGDIDPQRQTRACMNHILHAGLTLTGLLRHGSTSLDAAAAIATGDANLIVAAYPVRGDDLEDVVEAAGGRVVYVHNPDAGHRLTVRRIIARLHTEAGFTPQYIATVIGANVREVEDHLRRSGITPPRRKAP